MPYYGTSIALQKDGKTVAGFVTNLVTGIITYRAFDDEIKYFSIIEMKDKFFEIKKKILVLKELMNIQNLSKIKQKKIKFRCLGAVALSLSDANNYNFVLYAGNIRDF